MELIQHKTPTIECIKYLLGKDIILIIAIITPCLNTRDSFQLGPFLDTLVQLYPPLWCMLNHTVISYHWYHLGKNGDGRCNLMKPAILIMAGWRL